MGNKKPIVVNDEQLMLMASNVSDIYHQLTLDLFDNVIERVTERGSYYLAKQPYLWQLEKMNQMGLINNKNVATIAEYSGVAETQLREIIEGEGYRIYKDTYEQLAEAKGENVKASTHVMEDLISYSNQVLYDINNLINTTLPESVQAVYKSIIEHTVAKVVTGLATPEKALSETLMQWHKKGFYGFTDKQGKNWKADTYARTVIRSTVNRVRNEMRIRPALELGIDTFYYSKKATAREMCAPLQHRIVTTGQSRVEEGEEILSIHDYGYGKPAGCLGINCKHIMTPFILGVNSKPELGDNVKNITADQAVKNANIQAKQRAIERAIRFSKEQLHVATKLGDTELMDKYRLKVGKQKDALNQLLKDNAFLRRDEIREKYHDNPLSFAKEEIKLRKEKEILDKRRSFESGIIGLETNDGLVIKEITNHLAERIIQRSGTIETVIDALQNPLEVTGVKYDEQGRPSKQYRGKITTVAVNPDNGSIVSTNPTRRNIRKRHGVYHDEDK